MSEIKSIGRKQTIGQAIIDEIREMLDAAERGDVTSLVFVADLPEAQAFYRVSEFSNAWAILGALEYAKDGVFKSIGDALE